MSGNNNIRSSCVSRLAQAVLDLAIVVVVFILLVIPTQLSWISPAEFLYLPLEIFLLGLTLLLPGPAGLAMRIVVAALLAIGSICKIADMAALQIFNRPFNPLLDAHLLGDGVHLLQGSVGEMAAMLVVVLMALLLLGIFVLIYLAVARIQTRLHTSMRISAATIALVVLLWLGLWLTDAKPISLTFYQLIADHIQDTVDSYADLKAFRKLLKVDAYRDASGDRLLSALKGKDVLIVFVESYGRTLLDKPDFAAHIRPLLEKGSADLAASGISARSAYLTSPTVGGISWLSHATFMSGLWINSQVRYDNLISSERTSLNRLFQRAGWRTLAVQPAHTMDWPAGAYFGYDKIYAAQDLEYKGLPFNWVTMPDQYTLSALHSRERLARERAPVMAEIALISSHAPWTPIPQLLDWGQVGDGSIFNAQASAGDSPEVVWQDAARIQQQYRQAIEYSLTTIISYALTYGDENLVLLVLGDHQPAPLVTGESANRDVPIHLIARDTKVIDALQGWQWSQGLLPGEGAPVRQMSHMRDLLLDTFSAAAGTAEN